MYIWTQVRRVLVQHNGMFLWWQCILCLCQHQTECLSRFEDHLDIKLPANASDILTNASIITTGGACPTQIMFLDQCSVETEKKKA